MIFLETRARRLSFVERDSSSVSKALKNSGTLCAKLNLPLEKPRVISLPEISNVFFISPFARGKAISRVERERTMRGWRKKPDIRVYHFGSKDVWPFIRSSISLLFSTSHIDNPTRGCWRSAHPNYCLLNCQWEIASFYFAGGLLGGKLKDSKSDCFAWPKPSRGRRNFFFLALTTSPSKKSPSHTGFVRHHEIGGKRRMFDASWSEGRRKREWDEARWVR